MSAPLDVNSPQLVEIGGHWYQRVPELQGNPPPSGASQWASDNGAAGVTGAAHVATTDLQGKLGDAATNMGASGQAYQDQEHASGQGLKPGDGTGMMKDVVSMLTTLAQFAPQLFQTFSSAAAALASGGASVGSSLASTVNSVAHGSGGGGPSAASPLAGGQAPQQAIPAIEGQNQDEHRDDQQSQQEGR